MSSKTKKVVLPKPEPIITRNKSAQQKRKPKPKCRSPEPPPQTKKKPESPKTKKVVTKVVKKEEKLKKYVMERIEFYPNKLKRNVNPKKIKLKPKPNFKVIASTNKRKMGTPKQASSLQSPQPKKSKTTKTRSPKSSPKSCKTPELSMQEMIRLIEESKSLSDEDFMEILTCPSPVWWEDLPDGSSEDSIGTLTPDSPHNVKEPETNINTNLQQNNLSKLKHSEKFVKKQLKLENILGNIKKKNICSNPSNSSEERSRKISESTEECISDISFNEEEILKNLENMDIPIEDQHKEINIPLDIKKEIIDLDGQETEIERTKIKSEVDEDNFNEKKYFSYDNGEKNFKNDLVSSCIKRENNESDFLCKISDRNGHDLKITKVTENSNKKSTSDLSEYITVYKIIPENKNDTKLENNSKISENSSKSKTGTAKGKMNNFFKHSKNRRAIKNENDIKKEKETIDFDSYSDVTITKIVKENSRLKCESIDQSDFEKTENCDDKCSLVSDKQLSSCKNDVKISWSNSLMLNQT